MNKPIPYGKQTITEADIKAVEEVLRSDYLTQGPKIKEFEEAFADYVGSKYAVAVANGTAALHLSAMALKVKPGDKVITTPITFAASANCVRYCGGEVIFCDIDPNTYLLDINKVRETIEKSKDDKIVGIIPVDFAGYPVNMEEYRKLANEYNLWIIEDACHAPGGWFKDSKGMRQYCGNGNYADLAIFSFHPVKHIAAGEGGMVTTNSEELYNKLQRLRTHGITKNSDDFINDQSAFGHRTPDAGRPTPYPGWYMELQELGYNYRLSELHAALGLSQLKRADENLESRQKIATNYDEHFKAITSLKTPGRRKTKSKNQFYKHAYHLYILEMDNRSGLFSYLHQNNIFAQVHYIPLHLMPYYQELGWSKGDLPNAEKYYQNCISIPMFHGMSNSEQDFVIDKIIEYVS